MVSAELEEERMVQEVQRTVRLAVRRFSWNHQLDFDEVMGEAQAMMLKAIRTFKGNGGKTLRSWAYLLVYRHLTSSVRSPKWVRKVSKSELPPARGEDEPANRENFSIERLKENISAEAGLAVDIALGQKRMTMQKLVGVLIEELGWTSRMIQEVFAEVRNAL